MPLLAGGLALATLALPLQVDASLISNHEFDSGRTGAMSTQRGRRDQRLHSRARAPARATSSPPPTRPRSASLIVKDRQPILSLTSYGAHELLPIAAARARSWPAVSCASPCSTAAAARAPPAEPRLLARGRLGARARHRRLAAVARLPHRHVLYRARNALASSACMHRAHRRSRSSSSTTRARCATR